MTTSSTANQPARGIETSSRPIPDVRVRGSTANQPARGIETGRFQATEELGHPFRSTANQPARGIETSGLKALYLRKIGFHSQSTRTRD